MPLINTIKGLTPEAQRLLNFFVKGKRFAQAEEVEPRMIPRDDPDSPFLSKLTAKFAIPYYEGTPNYVSYQDIERFNRAAQQGFRLPAWRAVRAFPGHDQVDPSFLGRGAHVDLTPSGHASRIWSRMFGQMYDPSSEFTGLDPNALHRDTRLMSQVAIKPSRTPVFVTDNEVNSPDSLAVILGKDPDDLFYGVSERDQLLLPQMEGKKLETERWKRIMDVARLDDLDFLYPNIVEINRVPGKTLGRASRADKADFYLNAPRVASFNEYMKNKNPATWFGNPDVEDFPLSVRREMADELMSDPRKMALIGNPSYVVSDPVRMRDLGLAQFRDPFANTLYKKTGGLATLRKY